MFFDNLLVIGSFSQLAAFLISLSQYPAFFNQFGHGSVTILWSSRKQYELFSAARVLDSDRFPNIGKTIGLCAPVAYH